MKAKMIHHCIHVLDLERSLTFYRKALGFEIIRTLEGDDGSWSYTFIGNDTTPFELELSWERDRTEPYANAARDMHLGCEVDDLAAARALHEEMGCIVGELGTKGIYFIADPDGCWIEILPANR